MSERIEFLQTAFKRGHNVETIHVQSVPIRETFKGQIVWEGIVEVFEIKNHPQTKIGYGWVAQDTPVKRYATVLAVPPVNSPLDAVRAYIASGGT